MEKLTQEILLTSENMDVPILPIFIPSGGKEIEKHGYSFVVDSLYKLFNSKNIFFIDFTYLDLITQLDLNQMGIGGQRHINWLRIVYIIT